MQFLAALVLAATLAPASNVTTAAALRDHVRYLASDELEGRFTGSRGERLAGDYAAAWFEKHGLKPSGVNGTFFQEFPASAGFRAAAEGNKMVFTVAGRRIDAGLGKDFNPVLYSKEERVEAAVVFAGEGVVADGRDDFLTANPQGRIAMVFSHANRRTHNYRTAARVAKEKGAIGIIFVGPALDGEADVPLVSNMTSIARDADIAAAAISPQLFERISGMNYAEARKRAQEGRVALGFPTMRVELSAKTEANTVTGRNIIAMLPGNDPDLKSQYIVLGAHIDHVGRGQVGSGSGTQRIHNGADDNASGSSTILELAKYFAESKSNRRTIVFQLYSGEELGLIGSNYFVRNSTIPLDAVTAMINMDMIGNLRDRLTVDGVRSSSLWPNIVQMLEAEFSLLIDPRGEGAVSGRSDHAAWERAGIPVLFFFSGFHERYHRDNDTHEHLNYEGLARIADAIARVVAAVDQRSDMMPFKRGDNVTRRTPPPPPSEMHGGQRRVRVGLVPEYGDGGPGLLLSDVVENSAAEKGGLRAGDRIVMWGEIKISSIEDIQEVFSSAEPGKPVKVTVLRGGEEILLTITPDPILLAAA